MKEQNAKSLLLPVLLTVFLDLLGVTIVIPILAPLFLDLKSGIAPVDTTGFTPVAIHTLLRHRTILFGFLIASYPLAQFFGAPILGTWADQVGRKKVLLFSLVGTLIGYALFAIGVHQGWIWLLFASRILDGFTGGNISIAFSAISDISTPEEKTKNFGLIGMAFGLGFIIGPYLGGKLADPSVWHGFTFETPFWFSCILCLFNIFLVRSLFFETLKTPTTRRIHLAQGLSNIRRAMRNPSLRSLFVVVFLLTFGFSIFTQFLQVFLIQKFQFSQSKIGDYFAFIGLCIAFTQGFITRRFTHKIPTRIALSVFIFILSIALLLILLPDKVYLLYCISPLMAICQGVVSPNMQTLVSESASVYEQGEVLGINQSVQSLAQAIPPIVAGYIVSIHMNLPILTASAFTFLAWVYFMGKIGTKKPAAVPS